MKKKLFKIEINKAHTSIFLLLRSLLKSWQLLAIGSVIYSQRLEIKKSNFNVPSPARVFSSFFVYSIRLTEKYLFFCFKNNNNPPPPCFPIWKKNRFVAVATEPQQLGSLRFVAAVLLGTPSWSLSLALESYLTFSCFRKICARCALCSPAVSCIKAFALCMCVCVSSIYLESVQ